MDKAKEINVDDITKACAAKDWKLCAKYTKEALEKYSNVIQWEMNSRDHIRYAEWQACEPMSWKHSSCIVISWEVWSVPTPSRRVGNSWSGGNSSLVKSGSYVNVTPEEREDFLEAMKEFQ